MNWTQLPTDYTDATWSGLKRYNMIKNDDDTVSFQDVTSYTNKEKSFFGAKDANKMNEGMNTLASQAILKSELLNAVYPIGSIYLSINKTNPSTIFGGTWVLWGSSRTIVGATATGTAEAEGGSPTASVTHNHTISGTVNNTTLTADQIPSHSHTFTGFDANTGTDSVNHYHGVGAIAASVSTDGEHTHTTTIKYNDNVKAQTAYTRMGTGSDGKITNLTSSAAGSHTHTVIVPEHATAGVNTWHTHSYKPSGSISNTGGSGGHNHGFSGSSKNTTMNIDVVQPYITCFMWKRTA